MHYAFPVMEILLPEWFVEAKGVTRRRDVSGQSAFAEHLLDRVAGDQVYEKKDETDDQPDDREGVEDALEKGFQGLNFHSVIPSVASASAPAESKDPCRSKADAGGRDPSTSRDCSLCSRSCSAQDDIA